MRRYRATVKFYDTPWSELIKEGQVIERQEDWVPPAHVEDLGPVDSRGGKPAPARRAPRPAAAAAKENEDD